MELKELSVDVIQSPALEMRSYVTSEKMEELVESLKKVGMIHPIRVKSVEDGYEIVCGQRRYMAAVSAGFATVPAIIVDGELESNRVAMLHENIVREDVDPVSMGRWLLELKKRQDLTNDEIGKMFGYSKSWVESLISLTRCDEPIQDAISAGLIDKQSGRRLQSIADPVQRRELLRHAVKSGATQAVISGWVAHEQVRAGTRPAAPPISGALRVGPSSEDLTFTCAWCKKTEKMQHMITARFCPECYSAFKAAVEVEARMAADNKNSPDQDDQDKPQTNEEEKP